MMRNLRLALAAVGLFVSLLLAGDSWAEMGGGRS